MLLEFGLTPVSRARVHVPKREAPDAQRLRFFGPQPVPPPETQMSARAVVRERPEIDLAARVADLERRLAVLERQHGPRARGPRDPADRDLLVTQARLIGDHDFSVSELLAHARVDARLQAALVAADIRTPRELGQWLRRMREIPIAGVVLRHLPRARRAARRRWIVVRA